MARLANAGTVLALILSPAAAMAQSGSRVGAPPVPSSVSMPVSTSAGAGDSRWASVPGGTGAYRRPAYGDALPRYWVAAPHYIADYRAYGLPRPAAGFGWSRYYDDAVLTDRWGRVYDVRESYARDHGPDGRWSEGDRGGRKHRHRRDRDGGRYSYEGRWTGSWDGGPTRTYDGRFDGEVQPHWDMGERERVAAYDAVSTGGPIETPRVTTTTTTTTTPGACRPVRTVRYVPVSAPARRPLKERPLKSRPVQGS